MTKTKQFPRIKLTLPPILLNFDPVFRVSSTKERFEQRLPPIHGASVI